MAYKNVYKCSMHFFIRLKKAKVKVKEAECWEQMKADLFGQSLNAICRHKALGEMSGQVFCFDSHDSFGRQVTREIEIQTELVYSETEKGKESFYLVIGSQVDMEFPHTANDSPYSKAQLCSETDLMRLRLAFEDSGNELTSKNNGDSFPAWLKQKLALLDKSEWDKIEFESSAINLFATNVETNVSSIDELRKNFSDAYFDKPTQNFYNIFPFDVDRLAYGLVNGAEDNMLVPDEIIGKFKEKTFSQNITERYYWGRDSVLHVQTHDIVKGKDKRDQTQKKFDLRPTELIFATCYVLEVKNRLKEIEEILCGEDEKKNKYALCELVEIRHGEDAFERCTDCGLSRILECAGIYKEIDYLIEKGNAKEGISLFKSNFMTRILAYSTCFLGVAQILSVTDSNIFNLPSEYNIIWFAQSFRMLLYLFSYSIGFTLLFQLFFVYDIFRPKLPGKIIRLFNRTIKNIKKH